LRGSNENWASINTSEECSRHLAQNPASFRAVLVEQRGRVSVQNDASVSSRPEIIWLLLTTAVPHGNVHWCPVRPLELSRRAAAVRCRQPAITCRHVISYTILPFFTGIFYSVLVVAVLVPRPERHFVFPKSRGSFLSADTSHVPPAIAPVKGNSKYISQSQSRKSCN